MSYAPFERGPHPVGVTTETWHDASRERSLVVEVWYPAAPELAGADLDPSRQDTFVDEWAAELGTDATLRQKAVRDAPSATGRRQLILSIHGWAGHRREATFVATHLASHGFTVVAPDVVGSTANDVEAFLTTQRPVGSSSALSGHLRAIAQGRRGDVTFLIDRAAQRFDLDDDHVGITGASFGGWSSLGAPAWDPRIAATVPMCPANDFSYTSDRGGPLAVDFGWTRDVPTLFCVADQDSLLPLSSQLSTFRRTPTTWKRMVVLADADHNHFVDDIDTGQRWLAEYVQDLASTFPDSNWDLAARTVLKPEEMSPGTNAQMLWQGLATAHFSAFLSNDRDAATFMAGDLAAHSAPSGAVVHVIDGGPS